MTYLDDLEPRLCACGEPTGSVALDSCARCEGRERARRAIRDCHAEAALAHARAVADLHTIHQTPQRNERP